MNSGIYYLQFFDPRTNTFKEENNYFSISRFYNSSNVSLQDFIVTPDAAFNAGLLTSGQATGIGFQVITTGVGSQASTQLLYGEDYTLPSNDETFSSDPVCVNGLQYIKIAITGAPDITGYAVITGYYLALEANPLPGLCP